MNLQARTTPLYPDSVPRKPHDSFNKACLPPKMQDDTQRRENIIASVQLLDNALSEGLLAGSLSEVSLVGWKPHLRRMVKLRAVCLYRCDASSDFVGAGVSYCRTSQKKNSMPTLLKPSRVLQK